MFVVAPGRSKLPSGTKGSMTAKHQVVGIGSKMSSSGLLAVLVSGVIYIPVP